MFVIGNFAVSFAQTPKAGFISKGTLCLGDTIWFYNASLNYTNSNWDFGDANPVADRDTLFRIFTTAGVKTILLTVINSQGSDHISKSITINPAPIFNIVYNGSISVHVPATVPLSISGGTFNAVQWYNASNEVIATGNTIQLSNIGQYILHVKVTDAKGCTNIDTTKLITISDQIINPDSFIITVLNNVLTPQLLDGINDYLKIKNLEDKGYYPSAVAIYIYNSWGDLVFTNPQYDNKWSGVSSTGKPLNAGTYYYIIKTIDNKHKPKMGFIDILR